MAANLDRPKIITPTGCPNGAMIVGTGSDIVAHTLVSGTDEIDVVTIECYGSTRGTVKWPSTAGGTVSLTADPAASTGPAIIIDRFTGNGGGSVIVNGAATCAFKVSVERYPAGSKGDG